MSLKGRDFPESMLRPLRGGQQNGGSLGFDSAHRTDQKEQGHQPSANAYKEEGGEEKPGVIRPTSCVRSNPTPIPARTRPPFKRSCGDAGGLRSLGFNPRSIIAIFSRCSARIATIATSIPTIGTRTNIHSTYSPSRRVMHQGTPSGRAREAHCHPLSCAFFCDSPSPRVHYQRW